MNEQELKKKIEKLEEAIGGIHYHFKAETQELWIECRETRNIFYSYLFANILNVELDETGGELIGKKEGEELIHFYEELSNHYKKMILFEHHAAYALMNESHNFISSMRGKGYMKSDKPNRTLGLSGTEFVKKTEEHQLTKYEQYIKAYDDFFKNQQIPLFKLISKERLYYSFYYFNQRLTCILKEINGKIMIVMLNKKYEEIKCLPINHPNEMDVTMQTYLQKIRHQNRVKHILQEEKYFLNEFLHTLNIDYSTIIGPFYALLQSFYTSIEIEELAFTYLEKKENLMQKKINGGFFVFQFGNHLYVVNEEKACIHELKEEALESFIMAQYKEKLKKELHIFSTKKEKN